LGPTPKLTKPTWRESFFKRRCIVPATAFYERINIGTPQAQWVRFRDPSSEVLAIAGLFEEPNELSILPSYAMVTTEPNARVGDIHDRMPVLLSMEDARSWMDKEAEPEELLEMLRPCPDEWVEFEPELLISEHRRLTKERRAAEQAGLGF
jgi:putative SOS response-associated peptidase YedK